MIVFFAQSATSWASVPGQPTATGGHSAQLVNREADNWPGRRRPRWGETVEALEALSCRTGEHEVGCVNRKAPWPTLGPSDVHATVADHIYTIQNISEPLSVHDWTLHLGHVNV